MPTPWSSGSPAELPLRRLAAALSLEGVLLAGRGLRALGGRRLAERLSSGALFSRLDDEGALARLLEELREVEDRVARTERAMIMQLIHDRARSGPPLRGPYYEEGELVRHLERGDSRLVRRHFELMRLSGTR